MVYISKLCFSLHRWQKNIWITTEQSATFTLLNNKGQTLSFLEKSSKNVHIDKLILSNTKQLCLITWKILKKSKLLFFCEWKSDSWNMFDHVSVQTTVNVFDIQLIFINYCNTQSERESKLLTPYIFVCLLTRSI